MNKFYPPERYEKPESFRSLIKKSAEKYGNKPLFKYIKKNGEVGEVSFVQFYNDVKSLGTAYFALQFAGKKVAILSESRPEWVTAYMAAFCTGSVVIPLDKELLEEQIRNFIEFSEADVLFYSESYAEIVKSMSESLPDVKYFICFDGVSSSDGERFKSYKDVLSYGERLMIEGNTAYARARIDSSKLSAIIFTSGTTGTSKGVMLSQDNILACVHASANMVDFSDKDVIFSVLPLHHTYEMSCGILTPIMIGVTVCFNNSLKYFMRNINIFKPTGMILVPLFVSTIYKKIMEEVAKKNKLTLFKGAVAVTKNLRKVGLDVRSIAFAEINKALGGNMRKIICGGAALDPNLVDRFEEFGITICEGYGITECSPLVSVNPYKHRKNGSVGIPVKNSIVKIIIEDENKHEMDAEPGEIGEICVKSPQVMLGYYKNPEATADAFNQEGFFKTGDYGYIDEDGYLYITGRKKNIIVLPNGKNVYPEEIEEYLYRLDIISECVVVGREGSNGEVILTAIIYPDYSKFEDCDQNQIIETMKAEVLKINKQLPIFKQIRNIELKKNEFEKTSTKKIMRHKI